MHTTVILHASVVMDVVSVCLEVPPDHIDYIKVEVEYLVGVCDIIPMLAFRVHVRDTHPGDACFGLNFEPKGRKSSKRRRVEAVGTCLTSSINTFVIVAWYVSAGTII